MVCMICTCTVNYSVPNICPPVHTLQHYTTTLACILTVDMEEEEGLADPDAIVMENGEGSSSLLLP